MQGVESIIQGLIFFYGIRSGRKQLSRPGDNCFFSVCDTVRNPILIRFE
jgi:hypothetical protein